MTRTTQTTMLATKVNSRPIGAPVKVAPGTLGAAFEAFILEHEYCGELDAWLRPSASG